MEKLLAQMIAENWLIVCSVYPELITKKPRGFFNNRLRTTAANVDCKRFKIFINTRLFRLFPNEYNKQLILHEMAHIVDSWYNGAYGSIKTHHRESWQEVMINLGLEPLEHAPDFMFV